MSRFEKTAVPAARSSLPMLKIRRRVTLAVLLACIVSGLLSLAITLSSGGPAQVSKDVDERSASVAEIAARDFLAEKNSTVPAADGVNTLWEPSEDDLLARKEARKTAIEEAMAEAEEKGEDPPEFIDPETPYSLTLREVRRQGLGDNSDQPVDLVTFLATRGDEALIVNVPMLVDPTMDTPVLAAAPSVSPAGVAAIADGEEPEGADLSNYTGVEDGGSIDPAVSESITRWATAYAEGGEDSDELRAVTDDQESDRSYDGLGGWTAEVTKIANWVPVTDETYGEGVIARVDLALTPPAANGPTLNSSYDVYVLYTGSEAQPPVVAWGPAGSFDELTPYTYNANQS